MIPIKWILCLLVNFLQHVISIYGCFYRENKCVISIFNTEKNHAVSVFFAQSEIVKGLFIECE